MITKPKFKTDAKSHWLTKQSKWYWRHFFSFEALRSRGWNQRLVAEHLGNHDKSCVSQHGSGCRLWEKARVRAVEKSLKKELKAGLQRQALARRLADAAYENQLAEVRSWRMLVPKVKFAPFKTKGHHHLEKVYRALEVAEIMLKPVRKKLEVMTLGRRRNYQAACLVVLDELIKTKFPSLAGKVQLGSKVLFSSGSESLTHVRTSMLPK